MTLFFLLWYWFCTRFANWMGQFCGFISHIRTSHGTFSHQGLVITRDIQPRRSINFFLTNFNSLVMEWWLLIWLLIHFFLPRPYTYAIYCHKTILSIHDSICIPMIHPLSIWNIHRVQAMNLLRGQVLCWMNERYTHIQYFPLSNKYQVNYNCKFGPMQLCKIQYTWVAFI